jgi:hypothetical protein
MPLFIFFNTQTMHIKSIYIYIQQQRYDFLKKTSTLPGFEPRSSVP